MKGKEAGRIETKRRRDFRRGVYRALLVISIAIIVAAAVAGTTYLARALAPRASSSGTPNIPPIVATIELGKVGPWAAVYDSGKGEVFVANSGNNTVSVISDPSNAVGATVPVGVNPAGLAYDSARGEIFVTNYNCRGLNECTMGTVSVISDSTNKVVATINVGLGPNGVIYDTTKGEIFVADQGSNSVLAISDATNSVVANISVGSSPFGLAYNAAKGQVFVSLDGTNNVSVISDASNNVVANVAAGPGLQDIAYDSKDGELFVPTSLGYISVISDSTYAIVAKVPLFVGYTGITYDSGTNQIYVADYLSAGTDAVSVISPSTNSVVANVTVGCNPVGLAYDSAKNEVFVTNLLSGTVSVISDYLDGESPHPITVCPPSQTSTQSTSIAGLAHLHLNVETNVTMLNSGQELGITISLDNTSPNALNLTTAEEWTVPGFPVAMFPGCIGQEPIEFMIIKGSYTLGELQQASANTSISSGGCMEGGSINNFIFRPESSTANLTGFFCTANCFPQTDTYDLTTNFTVSGYWDYPVNSSEANDVLTPAHPSCTINGVPGGCVTFNYPEVGPIAQHQFIAGEYTLVVTDEWGQVVTIQFKVA